MYTLTHWHVQSTVSAHPCTEPAHTKTRAATQPPTQSCSHKHWHIRRQTTLNPRLQKKKHLSGQDLRQHKTARAMTRKGGLQIKQQLLAPRLGHGFLDLLERLVEFFLLRLANPRQLCPQCSSSTHKLAALARANKRACTARTQRRGCSNQVQVAEKGLAK